MLRQNVEEMDHAGAASPSALKDLDRAGNTAGVPSPRLWPIGNSSTWRPKPPRDQRTLRTWAKQLGHKPGSDDWLRFLEFAAVDAGRFPDHILEGKGLAAHLPTFFLKLYGQKPSRENSGTLLGIIKGTRWS